MIIGLMSTQVAKLLSEYGSMSNFLYNTVNYLHAG